MLNDTQHSARHSDFNLYGEFASTYRQVGFPDLMQLTSGETCELATQAELLDDRLREWLRGQNVSLQEFENLEDLERSLPCRE
jgi:hypothetical protein